MKIKEAITRLQPNHLVGQIALLTFAAVVIYQCIIIVMFHVLDIEGRRHYVSEADFITSVFLSLEYAPSNQKKHLIKDIISAAPYLSINVDDKEPIQSTPIDPVIRNELSRINSHLPLGSQVFWTEGNIREATGSFVLYLSDRSYANITITQQKKPSRLLWRWAWEPEPDVPFYLTRWVRMAFLFLISASILIIWMSNTIVNPLIQLAKQAEEFPREDKISLVLPPQGPVEVKNLKRSIMRMQDRILKMISAQKHMIAAVSHDLRSITTRLKLRIEFIDDSGIRTKIGNDIKIMEEMLSKNLQYLQADYQKEKFTPLDIDSVLHTVSDEFSDAGFTIDYSGGAHQKIIGSLPDMMRVFTNLLQNAVRVSKSVSINITDKDNELIVIEVIDDGPGIPNEIIDKVFEPFVRGEIGRTLGDEVGFGLGLSIVQNIIMNHGGEIELQNRKPHGLIARITLPRVID